MRTLALILIATALAAGETDLLTGLQYTDGAARGPADFAGRTVLLQFFCGNCPSARAFMKDQGAAIAALVGQAKKPLRFIAVTPDKDVPALIAWAKEMTMEGALVASDPANRVDISLKNILQYRLLGPDGQRQHLPNAATMTDQVKALLGMDLGHPRYAVGTLTDPVVRELWWNLELGRPTALATLLTGVKQARQEPAKTEIAGVLGAVTAATATRQASLVAAPVGLSAYEDLEAFVQANQGLDAKAAQERLKSLAKEAALKDELAARTAWQKVQPLLASKKPSEQKAGAEGLAAIAKRFPATVYGQRAASGH